MSFKILFHLMKRAYFQIWAGRVVNWYISWFQVLFFNAWCWWCCWFRYLKRWRRRARRELNIIFSIFIEIDLSIFRWSFKAVLLCCSVILNVASRTYMHFYFWSSWAKHASSSLAPWTILFIIITLIFIIV